MTEKSGGQYLAEIKMYANDQQGLLMEISRIFTEGNVDVKSMNVRTSKKGTATIEMGFIVHGREELERIREEAAAAFRNHRYRKGNRLKV